MSRVVTNTAPNQDIPDVVVQKAIRMVLAKTGVIVPAHRSTTICRHLLALSHEFHQPSVSQLLDQLELSGEHPAWHPFISIFTINHTSFFREAHHFEHLASVLEQQREQCRIWSAAVSTGEEAYSIAMTVLETLGQQVVLTSPILATDVDASAVACAQRAQYQEERIKGIGLERLKSYCLKGVGGNAGQVKIKSSLVDMIRFEIFNLNALSWPAMGVFDVVFCRNVMIYFNVETQVRLLERFAAVISPGGFLYVGHSENMAPLTRQFKLIGQSIYQRVG